MKFSDFLVTLPHSVRKLNAQFGIDLLNITVFWRLFFLDGFL